MTLTPAQASQVRALYKEVCHLSRAYPGGAEVVKRNFKKEYAKHVGKDYVAEPKAFRRAYGRGEWYIKELRDTINFAKYRRMKVYEFA